MDKSKKILNRRDAIKILAATTGAVALGAMHGDWETPLVQIGALPAHAQCSDQATFTVTDNTTTGTLVLNFNDGSDHTLTVAPGGSGSVSVQLGVNYTWTQSLVGSACDYSRAGSATFNIGFCDIWVVECRGANNISDSLLNPK